MRKLYSDEAEQHVLGSMLINQACVDDQLEMLSAEDFYHVQHQAIFSAIGSLRAESKPVDIFTVGELVESKIEPGYLIELHQSTPNGGNVGSYARAVLDRKQERDMLDCAIRIQSMMFDPELTTEQRLAESQALFTAISSEKQASTRVEIKDSLKALLDVIDNRHQGLDRKNQIRTGLADIDKRILGYRAGNLILVGARPGMGKTTFGMAVVKHVAQHYGKTLVFSLEMPHTELASRLVASCGQADMRDIRDPQSAPDSFWPKLTAGTTFARELPIVIDDQGGISITQLASRARREHRMEPLKLIMVDYIQLMKGSRKNSENRTLEIGEISMGLKNLAKELNCPVVALSQLNRGLESRADKKPIPSDLRESGSLEQDADIIHFLYRDEVYNPDTTDRGVIEVNTAKFRDGETGTDRLMFEGQFNRITDYDHSKAASQQKAYGNPDKFSYGSQ